MPTLKQQMMNFDGMKTQTEWREKSNAKKQELEDK